MLSWEAEALPCPGTKQSGTSVLMVNSFWNSCAVPKPTSTEQATSEEAFSLAGRPRDSDKFQHPHQALTHFFSHPNAMSTGLGEF